MARPAQGPRLGVASSLLNTLLYVLEEFQDNRNPLVREAISLVRAILEVSWWVLTFFVVPVMLFRETTIGEMFTTSGRTFVDTWGETATASLGISLLWLVVSLVLLGLTIAAAVVLSGAFGIVAVSFGVVALAVALLVRATTEGVIKAGLWQYATTGTMPGDLAGIDWEGVFVETADQPPVDAAQGRSDDVW